MLDDRSHKCVTMSYQRTTLRICLLLLSLTINDVVNVESTCQHHSSVYVKNGDDQAAIHTLPTGEKVALENEILRDEVASRRRLNLKSKSTNGKASSSTGAAAKFMINAYNLSANEPNESVEPSEFDLTENDLRTISQSDVIITFMAQQSHQGPGNKHDGVERIWFNVKAAPAKDQMISAQLRLYRNPNAKNLKNRGEFTITAYRVQLAKDGDTEMQLVDSVNTTSGQEGWITLDVTESLLHWIEYPGDNNGLYLSVSSVHHSSHGTIPEDIGIVGFESDDERQPFMTGFFRNSESEKARSVQPAFRSFEDNNKRNKKRDSPNKDADSSCKVEKLYLSFTNPVFDARIIAPEGFYANYCSGECNYETFPEKATNHSKFMSHANWLQPEKVPKPCCAPMKLSPINIVRFIDDKTVSNEYWENMSVESCGCY